MVQLARLAPLDMDYFEELLLSIFRLPVTMIKVLSEKSDLAMLHGPPGSCAPEIVASCRSLPCSPNSIL